MKRSKKKTTYAGAVAQILALGFAASVLLTILSFIFWAMFVQKQGFPIEILLIVQFVFAIVLGFILIAIKGTKSWSHFATFGVLFGGLSLVTIVLLFLSNQALKKESGGDWDARKMLLSALEDYEKNTKACLKYFESVTNRESAQQTIIPLSSQLSSLGGNRTLLLVAAERRGR